VRERASVSRINRREEERSKLPIQCSYVMGVQWGCVHATHNHLMTNYDTSKGRRGQRVL
jgi:hypothetical protein